MSDPVAAKSGFLCMYMSNHPDTLVGYVKHWGKVKGDVTNAQMIFIETNSMTLTYETKTTGNAKQTVRVEFDPPLAGYEEVKPRLLSMKVDAEEALGMAPAPQITNFKIPYNLWVTVGLVGALCYVTWAPSLVENYGPIFAPGAAITAILPSWAVPASWYFLVPTHAMEALYAFSICRKHSTPFIVGLLYIVGAFIFGFPFLGELRRQKHAARIDSILKGK